MEKKADIAVEIYKKGFNCAQAVVSSHCEELGLDPVLAKKVAGAFGGGIANNGEICGAVTGALMLIGLKYGRYREDDTFSKGNTTKITNSYLEEFKKEFGSLLCRDLVNVDFKNEAEVAKARESGILRALCPKFVKKSVELLEEIL